MSALARLGVLFATIAAGVSLASAQFRVDAGVSPEEPTLDDTVVLTIRVTGDAPPRVDAPRLSAMRNLRVIGGPNHRTSTRWVNGKTTASVELIYQLLPEQRGPAEIPPIEVTVNGRKLRTERIGFQVREAGAGGRSGAQAPRPRSGGAARARTADVRMEATVGDTEVWVGQAVPLTQTLLTTENILHYEVRDEPAITSFVVQPIEGQTAAYTTRRGNRQYTARALDRKLLVPQAAGTYEIGSWVWEVHVPNRSGDPFSFFSRGRIEALMRRTQPITLEVKALPTAGRPGDFGGAVGRFELRAELDRRRAAVNEAVAIRVTVEGDGFLGGVAPPKLDLPPDARVFDPEVESAAEVREGRLVFRKTWEWILVPATTGTLELPEVSFPYFDPEGERYDRAVQPLGAVEVEPGAAVASTGPPGGEVRRVRRDLAFIKPLDGPLREDAGRAHRTTFFRALLLAPLVWVPAVVVLGRRRARLRGNRGLARGRKAGARARRRLKHAAGSLHAEDAVAFHEEVARALIGYVADRFDRSPAGLTYETADDLLASRQIDPELRRRFRSCLESCDFARFVPASGEPARRTELLDEAQRLVVELERAG